VTWPPYDAGGQSGPAPPGGYPPDYFPVPEYGYPPGYYGMAATPKPGCVPLRPLGVSDILDGSFAMIRRNPRVMLGLSAAVAVVQVLLVALFQVIAISQFGVQDVTSANDATAPTVVGPIFGAEGTEFVTFVASTLLGGVLTGMLTIAITQDVIGVRLGLAEVWARTKSRVWALLGIAVITTVAEIAGLLFLVVPGVWLWGIWTASVPALMTEQTTIFGALGRSRRLVAGTFWRVWGIRALGAVLASTISALITLPFLIVGSILDSTDLSAADSAVPTTLLIFTAVGSAISATFTSPIRAGIDALLYVDLRMRKEGLDIVLQLPAARSLGAGSTTAGPRTAF
jgi:hypothetical protein